MKKTLLLSIATSCMLLSAGESMLIEPEYERTHLNIKVIDSPYIGLGLSQLLANDGQYDITAHAATFLLGYKFNKYISLEARYSGTIGNLTFDSGIKEYERKKLIISKSVFAKPIFPINNFAVYGLLGFGQVITSGMKESAIQWGIGAEYTLNAKSKVFVDYTNAYDNEGFRKDDFTMDSVTAGMTYSF